MGESTRLRLGAKRVIEAMLADPEAEWTARGMLGICNGSEKAVDQVVEILLGSGAAVLEPTGRRVRMERNMPLTAEHHYRLTDDGPRLLQEALEMSRHSGGVAASLWFEGWEPAKAAWQARRFRKVLNAHKRRRHRPGRDSSMFDPYDGRSLGWLRRWVVSRSEQPRD